MQKLTRDLKNSKNLLKISIKFNSKIYYCGTAIGNALASPMHDLWTEGVCISVRRSKDLTW